MSSAVRKSMIILIAVIMVIAEPVLSGLYGGSEKAFAADGDQAITTGPGVLAKNAGLASGVQRIMYGGSQWITMAYDGKNGDGNVLGYNNVSGQWTPLYKSGTATFLYNGELETTPFRTGNEYPYNAYKGSDLEKHINSWLPGGERAKFTTSEQGAMVKKTIEAGTVYGCREPEYDSNKVAVNPTEGYLWALSEAEVRAIPTDLWVYNLTDDPLAHGYSWLLRTPGVAVNMVQSISWKNFYNNNITVQVSTGVRPGVDLDLDSIVLASSDSGKSGFVGADGLSSVGKNNGDVWKLTIKDNAHDSFTVESIETDITGALTIKYSGAKAGDDEYISAIVKDSSDMVKYYGKIAQASGAANASATLNTQGKWDPASGDKLYVFFEQCNDGNKTDYSSGLVYIDPEEINGSTLSGSGTEEDPYVITGASGWNALADFVAEGGSTDGVYYRLDKDIRISKSIGTADNPFSGVVEGNGKTITFNKTAESEYCAPFQYVGNASFKDLCIDGTINTGKSNTSGFIGYLTGNCTITDCVSDVDIIASTGNTHTGFISYVADGGHAEIEGSVFTGSITGENSRYCAGFIGWDTGNIGKIRNCMYDGAMNTRSDSSTFVRTTNEADNSYYMAPIGQGRDKGKQAHTITAASADITIDFGEGTEYSVSKITAYPVGLRYDGKYYAGRKNDEDFDVVSLTMPDPSADDKKYIASAGELTGSGTEYQLAMPDDNVVISKVPARFLPPEDVRLEVETTSGGEIKRVKALWEEPYGAIYYRLVPYVIRDGVWTQFGTTPYIEVAASGEGTASYEMVNIIKNLDQGDEYAFAVKAFDKEGNETEEIKSSNSVTVRRLVLNIPGAVQKLYVLDGTDAEDLIYSVFSRSASDKYYIDSSGNYYYTRSGSAGPEPFRIICFMPEKEYEYKSLAEMKEAAYFVPMETSKNITITKDAELYVFADKDLCGDTGEMHKWKKSVTKATTEHDGKVAYKCEVCSAEGESSVIRQVIACGLERDVFTYTGKAITPRVHVIARSEDNADGGDPLPERDAYSVKYSNNKDAGTATAKVTLKGYYSGSFTLKFTIKKAANPLSVKTRTSTVRHSKLKKKDQTLSASKAIRFVRKGRGKMTYKKLSGNGKIKIAKKTGKFTIKKGLKKGTYTVKLKLKAAGNSNYNKSKWKKVTVKIRVK